jgi:hypothetical protein
MVNSEEYIIGGTVIGISLIILGVFSNSQNPNSTAHISSSRLIQSLRSPSNDSTKSSRNSVNETANIVALDESVGGKKKNKTQKKK